MRLLVVILLIIGCGRPYEEPLPCPEYTPIPKQYFESDCPCTEEDDETNFGFIQKEIASPA